MRVYLVVFLVLSAAKLLLPSVSAVNPPEELLNCQSRLLLSAKSSARQWGENVRNEAGLAFSPSCGSNALASVLSLYVSSFSADDFFDDNNLRAACLLRLKGRYDIGAAAEITKLNVQLADDSFRQYTYAAELSFALSFAFGLRGGLLLRNELPSEGFTEKFGAMAFTQFFPNDNFKAGLSFSSDLIINAGLSFRFFNVLKVGAGVEFLIENAAFSLRDALVYKADFSLEHAALRGTYSFSYSSTGVKHGLSAGLLIR